MSTTLESSDAANENELAESVCCKVGDDAQLCGIKPTASATRDASTVGQQVSSGCGGENGDGNLRNATTTDASVVSSAASSGATAAREMEDPTAAHGTIADGEWLRLTVPSGAGPGALVGFVAPGGRGKAVHVPSGVAAGQDFFVKLKDGLVLQPWQVPVPEGVKPGDALALQGSDRRPLGTVVVPEDAPAGSVFTAMTPALDLDLQSGDEQEQLLAPGALPAPWAGVGSLSFEGRTTAGLGGGVLPSSLLSGALASCFCCSWLPGWRSTDDDDDEEYEDEEQLRERLDAWLTQNEMEEVYISHDGNCQFASVSEQLYGTSRHHASVREAAVRQLRAEPDRYRSHVPEEAYEDYVKRMTRRGTWGDHVTLQALADTYGMCVALVTGFEERCVLEVQPQRSNSDDVLWLSYVSSHYTSLRKRPQRRRKSHENDDGAFHKLSCR
eukprot:TRINITY_DN24121_c0_g2_i1.p1 TRINITY_DN24121_c0_g2~~TRINITY_DN24121_c0_g2_i1.p1  ORF type:complete len:442 (-),score=89.17 TRINITY_DN24121_c0_g2_i1:68-1393(-)